MLSLRIIGYIIWLFLAVFRDILYIMKYPVKLTVIFLILCIVASLAASVFVMLTYDLSILVAGSDVTFFSTDFFLRAFFDIVPFICILSLMILALYIIRHPAKRLPLYLTYAFLCLLAWGAFLPLDIMAAFAYEADPYEAPVPEDLSAGYFREFGGNVYFYSRVYHSSEKDKNLYGEGFLIDKAGLRGKAGELYPFTTAVTIKPRNGYTDTIFANATEKPPVVSKPVNAYKVLQKAARASWSAGIIPWIAFASMGLALFSIIFIRNVNSWRFLNASIVMAASLIVFTVNALIYAHKIFSDLSLTCADFFFNLEHYLPDIFSGVGRVREPLALFVNIAFMLFFLIFGFVCKKINSREGNITFFAEEDEE